MRRAFDWTFRSRADGRIVIAQWPNLSLWLFIVARVAALPFDAGSTPADVLHVVGTIAIVWWAVDELVRGVNPFRRVLGGVMLATQVVALVG